MRTRFDELLASHLNGTLTEEEKKLLAKLLSVTENQQYLAAKIDEQFFDPSLVEIGDEEAGRQIFAAIKKRLRTGKAAPVFPLEEEREAKLVLMQAARRKLYRWMGGVAASVLLVLALAVLLNNNLERRQVADAGNNKAAAVARLQREVNTTGKDKILRLPDGSEVVLANGNEISYLAPFAGKREINLTGKAYFKVAKDKRRPFTVISGDVSTTALGTEFSVNMDRNASRIVVRLYEGRVVVNARNAKKPAQANRFYLVPGQQLVYTRGGTCSVNWFRRSGQPATETAAGKALAPENPSIPDDGGSWYMFNNQSLPQVFDQLAEMYNTEIVYNKTEIQNLYFIGKFDRTDSLEKILQKLGQLNHLSVTKENNRFLVK